MELKSPLTIRQGSTVPFEQSQLALPPPPPPPPLMMPQDSFLQPQRVQTPLMTRQQYIDNPYNNRGVLRNNLVNSALPPQQLPLSHAVPQQRSVFLNRAYSETPRVAYTNGYETDSGLITNNGSTMFFLTHSINLSLSLYYILMSFRF
jgi:hypothetical protein